MTETTKQKLFAFIFLNLIFSNVYLDLLSSKSYLSIGIVFAVACTIAFELMTV